MPKEQVSFSTAIAGFAAALFLFVVVLADAGHAAGPLNALPVARNFHIPPFDPPRDQSRLQAGDGIAVLQAIEIALTQAGDGATYLWRRDSGRVTGTVRMTRTFRDADGRICRHMAMIVRFGNSTRSAEGIACRQKDGVWSLDG